jgi:hypothetical protein
MKQILHSGWLAAFACSIASGCMGQTPAAAEAPTVQPDAAQTLNQPVQSTMTCAEFNALLASDKRTAGTATIWLDGFYSARSGLGELPAGWVRTVSQGLGGTCAISVNASRTVLDVIGQLHREYGPTAAPR